MTTSNQQNGYSFTEKKRIRKDFGKQRSILEVPFLLAIGDLLIGWLLLEHAEIALGALDGASDKDRAFYAGKVGAAEFFARHILPRLSADRAVIESLQLGAMDLPEDAF